MRTQISSVGGSTELLAVLPDFAGGGAERVTLLLANGLAQRGRAVKLVVFNASGPLAPLRDSAVGIHELARIRLRSAMLPLLESIRRERPLVILSSLGYVNLCLLLMRPLLPTGARLWLREANLPSLSLPRSRYPRLTRAGYHILYPHADRVICSSQRMYEELQRDFAVPTDILCNLYNPVDVADMRRKATPVHRHPGPGPRFVAAGRLTGQKGFDRLLAMFATLSDANSQLTVLGDGPMRDELRARAVELGISQRVAFPGFISEPWAWYAGADAFLLPSRWEGMPNAALEALACGTPVIATPESGGISEVAALAQRGAVTVAEAGQEFGAAMGAVIPAIGGLRDSLLPHEFALDKSIEQIAGWLDNVN